MQPAFEPSIPPPRLGLRAWLSADGGFHAKLLSSAVAGVAVIVLLAGVFLLFHLREREIGQLRNSAFSVHRKLDQVSECIGRMDAAHREYLLSPDPDRLGMELRRW